MNMHTISSSSYRLSLGRSSSSQAARSHIHVAQTRSRTQYAARAASPPGASRAELESLLARREAELAGMFDPGRAMPKAADVAKLRQEVAAISDQLAGRPVQALVEPSRTNLTNQAVPLGAVGSVAQPSRPRSTAEEMANRAYEQVEQQMQMRNNHGKVTAKVEITIPVQTEDTSAEVARLEAENTQFRAQAYDLLQRQQQLETLLAEVRGKKPPEMLLDQTEGILARMKAKLQKGGR